MTNMEILMGALNVAGIGIAGVFVVLALFYATIKLLLRIAPMEKK